MCGLDTTLLVTPVLDYTSTTNGCTSSQYWSGSACTACDSSCLSCSDGTTAGCLSCDVGYYLNSGSCLVCDATHMTVGSSGQCVEICGKSLNFGLLECDNGAAAGCTDCTIATGYACTGGSPTTPDVCTTDYPE